MKGYKAFNRDWICKDFQFEVGKTYEVEGTIQLCKRGFHFCRNSVDCIKYYPTTNSPRHAEILAEGEILHSCSKSVTSKITIIREIPDDEWLTLCTGKFISYYKGGHTSIKEYLNGKLHGLCQTWGKNGKLDSTSNWENGLRHGLSEHCNPPYQKIYYERGTRMLSDG